MMRTLSCKVKMFSIALISILVIILMIVLYLKTDFLKTKEQLFWKYMAKGVEDIGRTLSNDDIKSFSDSLAKSSYIKEGNISISSKYGFVKPIDVEIKEIGDNVEKCVNTNYAVEYDGKGLTSISVIKDGEFFLINNENVDSNYICFENRNLKQLAKKLGIDNTTFIPDEFKEINLDELFSIPPDIQKHILKKYGKVFRKTINNKNYVKESDGENSSIMLYKVDISEEEAKKVAIDILNELYNDDITLDFICKKIAILDSKNAYCDIDNIRLIIKKWIDYLEAIDTKEKQFASIIIYRNENNVEKLEIILKNNRTICIQNEYKKNRIKIQQYDVKNKNTDLGSFDNIIATLFDSITEISYSRNIINGNKSEVNIDIECKISVEKIKITFNYVEQLEKNVEGLLKRNDVDYIDIGEIDPTIIKDAFKKALQINAY